MKVTVGLLKELRACEGQIELFEEVFPDGAETTRENFVLAGKEGLGLVWFGSEMFEDVFHSAIASAEEARWDARAKARYALGEDHKTNSDAVKAYMTAVDSAERAYMAAVIDALVMLCAACDSQEATP